jgi:hypothetical protein
MTDISIETECSITLIAGTSDYGQEWLDENVAAEPWQMFGGRIAADHRCASAIFEGAISEGLAVTLNGVEMHQDGSAQ